MRRSLVSAALIGCGGAPPVAERPPCSADTVIVLAGQDDVDAAAGCLTIARLTIRTGAPLDLSPLRKLHVVLGELAVGPTVGFDELRLPELHSVGALTVAGNGNLHGIFLPALTSAGAVSIEGNVALTTVSLPKLSKVAGDVAIRDNGDLELVELSALARVAGGLRIADNPQLMLLEVGSLAAARAVHVENNRALPAEVVERVKAVPAE